MTFDDHRELLDILRRIKGKAMLSGYAHPLYDEALSAWQRVEIDVTCSSSTRLIDEGAERRRPRRTEVVWANPQALGDENVHYIRYLHDLRREQEGAGDAA